MDTQGFPKTKAHLPVEKHMRYSDYKRIARDIILWLRSLSGHKKDYPCQKMAYANQPESDGTTVPPDFIQTYNSITRESILSLRGYLVEELEIDTILIPLRDIGVISIDEYGRIQNQRSAVIQRQQIITIVLECEDSDSSQIHKFLYVLHQTGQDDILNVLLRGQNINRTNSVADLVIEISRSVSTWELPHLQDIVENEQDIADIVGGVLELRLDDTWTGSVVLRLQSILKTKEISNNREKIERFLKKMYYHVKMQPGDRKYIDLKIRVIPKDKCIERRKPLVRDLHSSKKINETEEDTCVTCLQQIVRTNVKVLVAEIESDIISETFNQVGDTSAYVQNMCLSTKTTASRQQRALLFLKYVLHEKSYLREFYIIFKRKRCIDLLPVQCSTCSQSKSISVSDGTSDTQESTLTFILYREDGNNMVISVEDFYRPTMGPSIVTTTDDEKQKTEITRRNRKNFQTGKVFTALDKETSPPSTSRKELPMMKESILYHRQNSLPESVMEHLKHITASNSDLTAKVSHLSIEVDELKKIMKDRFEQQV